MSAETLSTHFNRQVQWKLKFAARCIRAGGVVAYPTEAVYGMGCDPLNGEAVQQLLAIKDRPIEKGLILIASGYEQLQPYVGALDKKNLRKIRLSWPGPVTWIVPAKPEVPVWLRGAHNTIAIRITAHPLAAALCAILNSALVSTSANTHRHPAARYSLQVYKHLGRKVDYILPGQTGKMKNPTIIKEALSGKIIRPE